MEEKSKKGFFQRFKEGLIKTRNNISEKIDSIINNYRKLDDELFDELEEVLIISDVGINTSLSIIENIKKTAKKEGINTPDKIKELLKRELMGILEEEEKEYKGKNIILMVGVNGVGKTTTIGKLANKFKSEGKKVILAAADTFRAAAIDQLEIWANRVKVDIIKHKEGSDPAAVVYDAIQAFKSRDMDILICDTAGRLHNKKNLMEELRKIYRVIDREAPDVNKEILLVLDATTGQNALQQAKIFQEILPIDGIVLTKLDGTAKGGIVIAIKSELGLPVRYVGLGEKIDDLDLFDKEAFVEAILG